ncbi:hypothetical protein [Alloactinosynnema sp. L-07]|nr:hypothetical protein [Alloactinosynnema sp. L-07]
MAGVIGDQALNSGYGPASHRGVGRCSSRSRTRTRAAACVTTPAPEPAGGSFAGP